MNTSKETKQVFDALFKCQDKLHNLSPNAQGYGYKYVSLDKLLNEVKPILKEQGLLIIQPISCSYNIQNLITRLQHISGEYIESTMIIPDEKKDSKNSTYQMLGSGITYCRRYAISTLLGITTEEDSDGHIESDNKKQSYNIDYKEVDSHLGTINDLVSLENYYTELKTKKLNDNQMKVINDKVFKRKEFIENKKE